MPGMTDPQTALQVPWEAIVRAARQPEATEAEELIAQLNQKPLPELLEPWQPQPNESAQEYYAFSFYRDQGPERKLPQGRLPRDRQWFQRAQAYDQWIATQPVAERATAEAISKSLLQTCHMLGHMLQVETLRLATDCAKRVNSSVTLPELVKAVESVTKISRLLTNQSTENVGVGRWDLSRMTAEEILELEEKTKGLLTGGGG